MEGEKESLKRYLNDTIVVVNARDNLYKDEPFKVYVGRPSRLGNPHYPENHGRTGAIDLFRKDLAEARVLLPNLQTARHKMLLEEIARLVEIYKQDDRLVLECWCAPLSCHADAIKEEVIRRLLEEKSWSPVQSWPPSS
jgi:hypothetical protein